MRISDWSSDVCSSDLLDVSLEKAKIGPELLESLGKGLNNLAESAKKMNTLSDAAVATNDYAKNVQSASKSLSEMNKSYDVAIKAVSSMAEATRSEMSMVGKGCDSQLKLRCGWLSEKKKKQIMDH